jgi:CubicO group peptidase (beta-lactamase class C family)
MKWIVTLAVAAVAQPVFAQELSAQGRERIRSFMTESTGAQGQLGAVMLLAQAGRVVELQTFGSRDLQRRVPMSPDAIFRIYSMSKAVAAVAALVLVDQGRLNLDDPVARHLPDFDRMQVFAGGKADAPQLRSARWPITVRQLLTHTAGFATGGRGIEEASQLLQRADLQGSADLKEYAARVARLPLASDPGERFRYDGVQYEVLGRVIEVASGMPLEAFVQEHIFTPLKMVDTGFSVPLAQRGRIVDISTMGPAGKLVLAAGPSATEPGVRLRPYASLAGGLYSTASDYQRFCQMLLNGGTLDGARVLGRDSVAAMLSNQLLQADPPPGLLPTQARAGEGMGLGGWVILDGPQRSRPGSVGSFGWSGAASTYFMIDPKLQFIAILLLQHLPPDEGPDLPRLNTRFFELVAQALAP